MPFGNDSAGPRSPREIGSEGVASWGLLTNMFTAGDNGIILNAEVFVDASGHVDIDAGIRLLEVTKWQDDNHLTDGDIRVNIIGPDNSSNAPDCYVGDQARSMEDVWTTEVLRYVQPRDSRTGSPIPLGGEWEHTSTSCQDTDALSEITMEQVAASDTAAKQQVTKLLG